MHFLLISHSRAQLTGDVGKEKDETMRSRLLEKRSKAIRTRPGAWYVSHTDFKRVKKEAAPGGAASHSTLGVLKTS